MYDNGLPHSLVVATEAVHQGVQRPQTTLKDIHQKIGRELALASINPTAMVGFAAVIQKEHNAMKDSLFNGEIHNATSLAQRLAFQGFAKSIFILEPGKLPVLSRFGENLLTWLEDGNQTVPTDLFRQFRVLANREITNFRRDHKTELGEMALQTMGDEEILHNAENFFTPQLEEALSFLKSRYLAFDRACDGVEAVLRR